MVNLMALTGQVSSQFVVAGSAGFVQGSKSLVDQQDMHLVNIVLEDTKMCRPWGWG